MSENKKSSRSLNESVNGISRMAPRDMPEARNSVSGISKMQPTQSREGGTSGGKKEK